MRRIVWALTLAIILLVSVGLINLATANFIAYLPYITIKSDGSIEPETEYINQTGNLYTLTKNLPQKYAITIQRSNIVFEGAGHIINGSASILGYSNRGLSLKDVTNVTIKDIEVCGFIDRDISIENSSKCHILRVNAQIFHLWDSSFNTITESNIGDEQLHLLFRYSNNNVIFRNNITAVDLGIGNSNIFFENNFGRKFVWPVNEANSWDNGSVGNYWSDYFTKYPNASEIGNSGIGDTPYVIDVNNLDNYPLMAHYTVLPSPSPTPEPQPEPEPLPVKFVAGAIGISAIIIGIVGLVYFKTRKKPEG